MEAIKITFKTNEGKEVELSIEEVRDLYNQLVNYLGIRYYYPQYYYPQYNYPHTTDKVDIYKSVYTNGNFDDTNYKKRK